MLEEGFSGTQAANLAVHLRQENRALVTLDLDFSNLLAYPPADYSGIIVLRTKSQDKQMVLSLIEKFIPLLDIEPLATHLWIVEVERIRLR